MAAPHIVFVCSRLDMPGGIEKAVLSLAGLFAEKGQRVTVLVLDESSGSFYPLPAGVRVRYEALFFGIAPQKSWLARKLDFFSGLRQLRRLWAGLQPDVVIATDYPYVAAAVLSGAARRAAVWSWEHHAYGWLKKSAFWKSLLAYAYPRLRGVVCVNKVEAERYRALNKNTVCIPNFTALPAQNSAASLDEKTILTVGWLIPRKGTDLLLEAARIVFEKRPDWRWKLIGTGELEPDVKRFVAENNLEKNLLLQPPARSNLSADYSNASVFVLPSRVEVFGLVLTEAMSFGLPCVGLSVADGPAAIIRHGEDGLLVPGTDAQALAEAVLQLVEDEDLRKTFGQNAKKNVRRFAPDVIYEEWKKTLNL